MNERLLENLSDQAKVDTRNINSVSGAYVSQWKKRFAELIVLECANLANQKRACDGEDIKEHFGVS
jgi:hypothetical protein